jgi:hypothetical protein
VDRFLGELTIIGIIIDVVPELRVTQAIAVMVPSDDRDVVIGLSAPAMSRDGFQQCSAGPDRVLDVESLRHSQQPLFAERPSYMIDGLDQCIGVKQDEVPSPKMHRELLVRRLVVEAPRQVTDLAEGLIQKVPRGAMGAPPERARVAGIANRKALIGCQVGRDDGGRESLRLGDLGELTI